MLKCGFCHNALFLSPDQLAQHIQEIRSQGFPNYHITPAGERTAYSSIIYLEPFSGRNLRAFGYDMLSEPVRRAAMEQARDENIAVISGKVTLVQETGHDVQPGVLMYVPVYRHGAPIDTVEQRRAAILGWVYSPNRMADMMLGTLSGWDAKEKDRRIMLQIYDGDVISPNTLLFDSQSVGDPLLSSTENMSKLTRVNFGGHHWTLRLSELGGQASTANAWMIWLTAIGGVGISLLSFGLVISVITTRSNARQIAARLTTDLRESEDRYRQMFEQNHAVQLLIDPLTGQILKANPAAASFYGYPLEKLQQLSLNDITPADLSETAMASQMVLTEKTSGSNSYHRLASGEVRQVKVFSSPLNWNGHRVLYSIIHDITDRKLVEERLTASEIRYRRLFETTKDGVLILDADTGRIVDVNPFLIELLGYTVEQFLEKEIWEIGIIKDIAANKEMFLELQQKQFVRYEDLPLETADGRIVEVEFVSNVYLVNQKKVIQCNIRDTTAHVEAERKIHSLHIEMTQLANIDGLTGINNHRAILKLAEHEFEVAVRYQPPLSMMFFDIDHFKQVNDTFGHAMGDQAIIKTIQTVCASLRSSDLIGRYGGDEFVILLPHTSAQDALPLAQRIQASIAAIRLETKKDPLTLTISIGIAQSIHEPKTAVEQADTVEDLLRRADQALYAAKQAGRNCTRIYDPAMTGA